MGSEVGAGFRLLHLDIETTPGLAYVWDAREQRISVEQIVEAPSILCFSAKWHGEKKIMFYRAKHRTGPEFRAMIQAAHDLLSEANAVCHFNGASFDVPRLNNEFLRLGMKPPPPLPQIDLKRIWQSKFQTISSRLMFVAPYLKIGEKIENEGWPLWKACMRNETQAWKRMEEYNRQDVALLEPLYLKLLPWIEQHPNMGLYQDNTEKPVCPNCGGSRLTRQGVYRAVAFAYARYQCKDCGRWSRNRLSSRALDGLQYRTHRR